MLTGLKQCPRATLQGQRRAGQYMARAILPWGVQGEGSPVLGELILGGLSYQGNQLRGTPLTAPLEKESHQQVCEVSRVQVKQTLVWQGVHKEQENSHPFVVVGLKYVFIWLRWILIAIGEIFPCSAGTRLQSNHSHSVVAVLWPRCSVAGGILVPQ